MPKLATDDETPHRSTTIEGRTDRSAWPRSRREILLGTLTAGGLAGCLGSGDTETAIDGSLGGGFTDTPTATPTPTPTGGVPEAERTQGEHPLPDGSAAIDRIVFGNAPSEDDHDLQGETSRVIEGKSDTVARQILKPEGNEDGLGSVSFTVDCDPDERTYLTLKLESSPEEWAQKGRLARIMLFDGDKIIGYKRNAEWPPANYKRAIGGQQHSEWVYATIRLPEYLTGGQESVELRLVNWEERDQASEPLYRAYTHTDPVFARPEDEERESEYDVGTLAGPREEPIKPVLADINNGIDSLQTQDRVGGPRTLKALGTAHSRADWIDAADPDAILETITATIDYYAIQQVELDNPLKLFRGWRSWHEHGALAQAFNEVQEALGAEGLLSESLKEHPEDGITRREAYTQFFHRALWWRALKRNILHNQFINITLGLVRMERALETLDPERYPATVSDWVDPEQYPLDGIDFEEIDPAEMTPPAESEDPVVERWIDEALGLAAMTDTDGWLNYATFDDDWYTVSALGMPIEHTGYAMSYSGVSMKHAVYLTIEADSERIQERFLEMLQAKTAMSWWVQLNGDRYAGYEGTFSSRKSAHVLNGEQGYGRFPMLNFLAVPADVTQTWAELLLETGTEAPPWELQQKILHVEGYRQLQDRESESEYVVPMDRERYLWSDEELGIITVIDGETHIKAELGQGGWTVPAVGEAARVHYHGPEGDRILTMDLDRNEFPWAGSTWTRPDTPKQANRTLPAYAPWRDNSIPVEHALAGEEVKQAAQPNGEEWTNSYRKNLNVHYREVQIGKYVIGMNSTGAKERGFGPGKAFEMTVPDGTVVDVDTGEAVSGETVTVEPQSTRVLHIE